MPTKIIIVEDEALIAIEIKSSLELLGHQVVGHAMNGDKALDLFKTTNADLVLLDISIKGTLNGIDLAKVIREHYHIPFIFLTSFSDAATLNAAKQTMPYGYIVKPFNEHDLKVNIEMALFKFSQEKAQEELTKPFIEEALSIDLTDREFDVLKDMGEGLAYKDISAKRFISVNTVKTYQKRLYQNLKINSKYELIQLLNRIK